MQKLSVFLIAALFITLGVFSTKSAKADIEVDISCGCHTPTPSPTPTFTPVPTSTPTDSPTAQPTEVPSSDGDHGLTPAGAPICTAPTPNDPLVTSIVRKSTSATLMWTKINDASYYLIFYGTKPGSQQFGVPNTGNVTTYTVSALDPRSKYYFDVRAVNDCMPSKGGQVLGASTSVLAATDSSLVIPRIILGIVAGGISFFVIKKYII